MNLQLANVLNDVSGMTGQAIIKAILAGERDPHKLAALRDQRVKASENQIAQSLEGHWQDDLLFVLKQEQDAYEFCQQQMAECDRRLERYLEQREDRSQGIKQPEEKRKEQPPLNWTTRTTGFYLPFFLFCLVGCRICMLTEHNFTETGQPGRLIFDAVTVR